MLTGRKTLPQRFRLLLVERTISHIPYRSQVSISQQQNSSEYFRMRVRKVVNDFLFIRNKTLPKKEFQDKAILGQCRYVDSASANFAKTCNCSLLSAPAYQIMRFILPKLCDNQVKKVFYRINCVIEVYYLR